MPLRIDGRRNYELRNIKLKLNVIPSAINSFYLELGSDKTIFALFGPILNTKENKYQLCHFKTIIFESFENFLNCSFLESNGLEINHLLERITFSRLFPNSKFYLLIRNIKRDGNVNCQLAWASQLLFVFSGLPSKFKIKPNNLVVTQKNILVDPSSEELFFMQTFLEIISEEERDSRALLLHGKNFKHFADLEKCIGYVENNFSNFVFAKIFLTKYLFSLF